MTALAKLTNEELSELCIKHILEWTPAKRCGAIVDKGNIMDISCNNLIVDGECEFCHSSKFQIDGFKEWDHWQEDPFSIANPAHLQMIEDKMIEDKFQYKLWRNYDGVSAAVFAHTAMSVPLGKMKMELSKHRAVAIAALKAKEVGME